MASPNLPESLPSKLSCHPSCACLPTRNPFLGGMLTFKHVNSGLAENNVRASTCIRTCSARMHTFFSLFLRDLWIYFGASKE